MLLAGHRHSNSLQRRITTRIVVTIHNDTGEKNTETKFILKVTAINIFWSRKGIELIFSCTPLIVNFLSGRGTICFYY